MNDVLILGASARAAIHSARRAGLTPHAADLFSDRDATAYATVRRCDLADYPDGLERLADTFPPMPWLYTGGLENQMRGQVGSVLRATRKRHFGNIEQTNNLMDLIVGSGQRRLPETRHIARNPKPARSRGRARRGWPPCTPRQSGGASVAL